MFFHTIQQIDNLLHLGIKILHAQTNPVKTNLGQSFDMFFSGIIGMYFHTECMICGYDSPFRNTLNQLRKVIEKEKKVGVPPPK